MNKSNYILALSFFLLSFCGVLRSEDFRQTATVRAVQSSLPWVVSIATEKLVKVNDGYDTLYHDFFGRIRRPRQKIVRNYSPLGSGIIISELGLILTNLHVVRRAETLEIRLFDGSSYHASLVGFDEPNDLAVLRMLLPSGAAKFRQASFAKPDDVLLGETVITIGNPFGLDHSVSRGVLSALNRSYSDDEHPFDDILQTDAAINPGNSGGPLINLNGDIIGINQAIRRDASGIGFAIPVKRIEQFLAHWLLPCRFSNADIGLDCEADIKQGDNGIIFTAVIPGSPADKAGLKPGSEITHVNGAPTRRLLDFGRAVWHLKSHDNVNLTTSDGTIHRITLEDMADDALVRARLGIHVQTLTQDFCSAVGLPQDCKGAIINEIRDETSFADQQAQWRKSLKRGDIILRIGDTAIASEHDLAQVLRSSSSGAQETIVALVYDASQASFILVRFQVYLK